MAVSLLHVFPSFAPGGIQMRLRTLAAGLDKPWQHQVVALDGDTSAFDAPGWPRSVSLAEPAFEMPAGAGLVARIKAMRAWLATVKTDLLITYNWGAIEWALAARFEKALPHLHSESGFGPDEAFSLNKKRSLFRRFVLPGSDGVLLCSQTLMAIAKTTWRLPEKRVHFVPDGIDLERFSKVNTQPISLFEDGDVIVGCVAPLRGEKNLTALLRSFDAAWRENTGLRLAIAGDGAERSALEAAAAKLPSAQHIKFLGFLGDIERFYAGIDICALSSDTEQLPNSILQAMAMELPIAAFGVGDIPHMVADGNQRFLPERRDEAGLTKAIARLAAKPELREALGQSNQQKCAQTYGQAQMVAGYERHITQALSQKGTLAA
ncbi:MAG: glycosyltransferase family 4 protein [Pseudomonadota bacterium]